MEHERVIATEKCKGDSKYEFMNNCHGENYPLTNSFFSLITKATNNYQSYKSVTLEKFVEFSFVLADHHPFIKKNFLFE